MKNNDKKSNAKMAKSRELINDINDKLILLEDEELSLPRELREANAELGLEGLSVMYESINDFEEDIEELVSDFFRPAARTIYSGNSIPEEYSKENLVDWLYDGLIGFILGVVGGGAQIANGQYAAANTNLNMADAGIGGVNAQTDAAWDVLTGRVTAEQQAAREAAAAENLAAMMNAENAAQGMGTNLTGQEALSQYMADQRRATYDNVQARQAPTAQQAADRAEVRRLTAGRVNESTATQIARN